MQRDARVTDCEETYYRCKKANDFSKARVRSEYEKVIKSETTRHRVLVYFSAVGSLSEIVKNDASVTGNLDDVALARRYDEVCKLKESMEKVVNKRWRWDHKAGKYRPRKSA